MIDLDQIAEPEIAPWPVWSKRMPSRRTWLSAALTAGVLLVASASVPGHHDPLPFLTSLPIAAPAQLVVADGGVFVLDQDGRNARIRAYGLPGGEARWTAHLDGDNSAGRIFAAGSTVVADAGEFDGSERTIAGLDAATGRERWRIAVAATVGVGSALFVWPRIDGRRVGGPAEVDRIDPETGRILWTASVPDACANAFDQAGFVELCQGTDLSVLDLATGRVRAHRTLDGARSFSVAAGLIVVAGAGQRTVPVSAYRATDLDRTWTADMEAGSALDSGCRLQVCVLTPHGVVELDRQTGVTVTAMVLEARTVVLHPRPGVYELVIVPATEHPGPAPINVTMTSSVPAGEAVAAGIYAPAHGVTTWITQERPDGSYQPVARLAGVGTSCVATAGYVICTTAKDRVSVWRLA